MKRNFIGKCIECEHSACYLAGLLFGECPTDCNCYLGEGVCACRQETDKYECEYFVRDKQRKTKMAAEDYIENIEIEYYSDNVPYGSLYITLEGTFLDLGNTDYGHSEISKMLNAWGIEEDYAPGEASKYLYKLGWIQANSLTGTKYIKLTELKPTKEQYSSLLRLLEYMEDNIQVIYKETCTTFTDTPTEEIMKYIRRFYRKKRNK